MMDILYFDLATIAECGHEREKRSQIVKDMIEVNFDKCDIMFNGERIQSLKLLNQKVAEWTATHTKPKMGFWRRVWVELACEPWWN